MKICIISPMKLPIPAILGGAIETIIDNVLRENDIKKRLEIDCYSIAYSDGNATQSSECTNVIYIDSNPLFEFIQLFVNSFRLVLYKLFSFELRPMNYSYLKISKISKNKEYDLIIFEGGCYSCARYFLKYYEKSKLILHLHHTIKENNIEKYFGYVVCVSQYVKKIYIENSKMKEDNVFVLKNVVNPALFKRKLTINEKHEVRDSLNIKNETILLFCGRIIEEKGVKELIFAYNSLNIKNLRLLIIGSSNFGLKTISSFEKEIFSLIESNPTILYLGYIDNSELYKYYQISDVFVMPSKWEEAAGLVNLEAMLSGLPIITTKMGGIPEYVNDDECIFVDSDHNFEENLRNAINSIVINHEIRNKLALKSQLKSSSISTENYYSDLVVILKKIVESEYGGCFHE